MNRRERARRLASCIDRYALPKRVEVGMRKTVAITTLVGGLTILVAGFDFESRDGVNPIDPSVIAGSVFGTPVLLGTWSSGSSTHGQRTQHQRNGNRLDSPNGVVQFLGDRDGTLLDDTIHISYVRES